MIGANNPVSLQLSNVYRESMNSLSEALSKLTSDKQTITNIDDLQYTTLTFANQSGGKIDQYDRSWKYWKM
jgi:hypothetical protein